MCSRMMLTMLTFTWCADIHAMWHAYGLTLDSLPSRTVLSAAAARLRGRLYHGQHLQLQNHIAGKPQSASIYGFSACILLLF